jgi:hypothetical protein
VVGAGVCGGVSFGGGEVTAATVATLTECLFTCRRVEGEPNMSTAQISKRISGTSPRVGSKFIGAYYLLTISTGAFVLFFHGRLALEVDMVVGILYLAVTALLYGLSGSADKKGLAKE